MDGQSQGKSICTYISARNFFFRFIASSHMRLFPYSRIAQPRELQSLTQVIPISKLTDKAPDSNAAMTDKAKGYVQPLFSVPHL